ncbi:unnamed protein product [Arctia plantaginis]|uniref:Lipase domain-containing protein n=1 Tax=Arctia plantaginis TaxID=874455 RepID=A0A8S0Z981_ARCPL|nr:unnamed protein product [Arctia plantaginis]
MSIVPSVLTLRSSHRSRILLRLHCSTYRIPPPAKMTRWLTMLSAVWLSSASAQLGGIFKGFTKELASVKDPIDKTIVFIGFSQCKHVKRIFGVDYEQYRDEPDMSRLTLDFITKEVKIQYNLNSLTSVSSSQYFKPKDGLIIYLHGFTDDPTKDSYKNISNAFLLQGTGNVLALDASSLIRFLYLRSSTMVRFIGQRLGEAIASMIAAGLDPASIHLVGHSLGSHIAGFTGKTVLALTGSHVGRISGLDPAGPCFGDVEQPLRLNQNDAQFVDVIHSNAGVYGMNQKVGHVDYYPNRGSEQPNCLFQTCSHSRAWLLFAESVTNPEGFPAVRCTSWSAFQSGACDYTDISYMGYGSKPATRGDYYLQTAGTPNYALGLQGINHTDTDGIVREIRDIIGLF